jgi:hypothetical protein
MLAGSIKFLDATPGSNDCGDMEPLYDPTLSMKRKKLFVVSKWGAGAIIGM